MLKNQFYILFFLIAQFSFAQQVNVFDITRTGNFNACSPNPDPIITAEIIDGEGSTVVDGALVISDPCGFTTLRITMDNLRYNQPGVNWPHGFFFPAGDNISISNVTLPAGWIQQDSCTGATCSTQTTGGVGFYYDGTAGQSCCPGGFLNDGVPSNNYGQSSLNCTPFMIAFDLTFCNSKVETEITDFTLLGTSDSNTGCWSNFDLNNNTVNFSISTVASDIPLYDVAPFNPEVITECFDGGGTLNYIAVLESLCGTGDDVTWWDAPEGGNLIGTGSPFMYDAPGSNCPEGMIVYASCCPDGEGCERSPVIVGECLPPSDEPIFNPIPPQCPGGENPLPGISLNGASGTWSPAFDPNNTTTYTFTPDPSQCVTQTGEVTVEILPSVDPTFNPIPPQCPGEPNPLPNSSLEGYTGTWAPAYNPNVTTTYTFTPDDGCASEITLEVVIEEEIIPEFALQETYCQSDELITLPNLSNNGYAGTWAPSSQIDLSQVGTTVYTFTPSDALCFQTFSLEIVVEEMIIPDFLEMEPICQNSTPPNLPTPTDPGITGTWDPPIINTGVPPGIYDFTFYADGNCVEEVIIQVEIQEELAVEVDMPLSYCQSEDPVLLPQNLDNGVTGHWIPGVIDTNTLGTSTYTFYPDDGQCALETPFVIEIYPNPELNPVAVQEICDDDFDGIYETDLTDLNVALGGGTGITYIYYASLADFNNDNPIPAGQLNNYQFTSLPATIYVVGQSGEGCRSAEIPVQFLAQDLVPHNSGPFGPIEYCPEDTVDLTQFTGNIGGGGADYNYYNTLNDARNQTNQINNPATFTPGTTQTSVFVRLDLIGYCPAFVEILLERLPTPSLQISETSMMLCEGDSFEATATSDDPDATFEWTFEDGTVMTGASQTIDQIGTYTVVAFSADGCISEERTLTVSLPSTPVITGIEMGNNFIIVSATNNSEGPLEYSLDGVLWQSTPQFNNLIPGETYTIWVRSRGCMIEKYDLTLLSVPNLISPNNDGKNDTWTIRGIEATPGATIKIFDRYGKIFVDTNFEGNYEWNGKYLGNNVPSGDYWYILHIPSDGIVTERKFVGHISVRNQ